VVGLYVAIPRRHPRKIGAFCGIFTVIPHAYL
jgi:hypothetical protein